MAKRKDKRRTSATIVKDKDEILDEADKGFLSSIQSTAIALYAQLIGIMKKITMTDGKFAPSETDNQILVSINKEINRVFANSTVSSKLAGYLTNFDRIENLNIEYFALQNLDITKLSLSAEKKLIIDRITDGLSPTRGLKTNIANPLKTQLYRFVTSGSSLTDAEDYLRTWIKGDGNRAGHLERYVRQLTQDGLSQYDGTINQKVRDEYDMPYFRYVGSVIKTTRKHCSDLVNHAGVFSDLKKVNGKYRVEDIPAIVRRSKGLPGWNSATTPETFFTYRGGYGCRHQIIPSL